MSTTTAEVCLSLVTGISSFCLVYILPFSDEACVHDDLVHGLLVHKRLPVN